jgi:hypothetical protein
MNIVGHATNYARRNKELEPETVDWLVEDKRLRAQWCMKVLQKNETLHAIYLQEYQKFDSY